MSLRPLPPDLDDEVEFAYSRMAPNGRRWSESPIPRVARRRVRMAGTGWTVIIRPDTIEQSIEQTEPFPYTGGADQNTLRDSSDSTYVSSTFTLSGNVMSKSPVATFEAATLPAGTITSVSLTIRVKSPTSALFAWDMAEDITGGNTYDPFWATGGPDAVTSSWVNQTVSCTPATDFGSDPNWYDIPTRTLLEAGVLQLILKVGAGAADCQIDVADVWLTVNGTTP